MAARRQSQQGDGSAFGAIVVLLLVVGVVIKYIWWFVGAAVLIALFFVGRAVVRGAEERREIEADLAAERQFDLQRSTERQHRWMMMGDSRAVYGPDGVSTTHSFVPPLPMEDAPAQDDQPIAVLAATAAELDALVAEKPQGWPQALFASVLVQRTAPLLPRLRDSELGFTPPATTRIDTAWQFERTVIGLIDEMQATAEQLHRFMMAPAFMAAFAHGPGDSAPDAEAITHIAHRTMDYQERFLELSERCRAISAPAEYSDILADCARLLHIPLQSCREFTADFVDVVDALPRVLRHATGTVDLGNLGLYIRIDDTLQSRIYKRLEAIRQS